MVAGLARQASIKTSASASVSPMAVQYRELNYGGCASTCIATALALLRLCAVRNLNFTVRR
jgi:hypothetical protein